MSTLFEAKIDGQKVFINVGAMDLDWFILADLDSSVCVVTIDDGGEHQSLARKGDLSEIRVVVE
jgi:hypothetical protein